MHYRAFPLGPSRSVPFSPDYINVRNGCVKQQELFDVVDEDGDGRLQSDEVLLMVITAIEGENQMDVEESKRILDSVEKDENGKKLAF